MAENKVRFGLVNVHYAILTETIAGGASSYSWGTPVAVPGAVSLTLDQQGDNNIFYADNRAYYTSYGNNGYSGSIEFARIPNQMLKDIWGYTEGETSKVLTENANVEPKHFALLYQIDGDVNQEYYTLYNCAASRPSAGSSTAEKSKEPTTQSCDITAVPLQDGKTLARTTAETPAETKQNWFNAVFEEEQTA